METDEENGSSLRATAASSLELERDCDRDAGSRGLAEPPGGPRSAEDVVIAGLSCRLPESDSPEELWQHLVAGRDMITEDDRRWPPGVNGLPKRNGKLKDLSRFDADFFRINPLQAHAMDPQLRILLEVVYEAMVDAGVAGGSTTSRMDHVTGNTGTTGVFVGSMFSESLEAAAGSKRVGYGLTGGVGSMLANYVSFCYDFNGPSEMVNTSCSASLCALHSAVHSIRSGECDGAIVAGTNVLLNPATAMHMQRLGMLSPEGACKAFDLDANGYVRSEGIVALYLTSRRKAVRSYLRVLSVGRACDGYKPEGITYPSSSAQKELIESTCSSAFSARIDPAAIYYVEAHGTGTQAGDFEECQALDTAICSARCKKDEGEMTVMFDPLLVGSVKSNLGHCEPTAGLAGIVKVALSFLHGVIPPNLHFGFPNPHIPSLIENRLSVITETTPLPADAIVGLNSFGFGGSISHALLQGEGNRPPAKTDGVSLVYPLSSCTLEGLENLMDFVATHRSNKDLLHLLSASNHQENHRGYVLWSRDGQVEKCMSTSQFKKRPVWFIFAGMGTQWSGIGKDLLQYPTFARTIDECYRVVPATVKNIVTMGGPINLDHCTVVDEVVAICATTLGLYNLLREVGITADGLVGHSLGELAVCYADGCLTLEQCMQVAYWRVKCVIDSNVPPGAMGAVGLTWEEAKKRCPAGVWPCCNNATKNVTVTGRKEAVEKFIAEVRQEGKFAKMIKSSGLAFHSPLMQPAVCQKTLEIMRKIIPKPKRQSPKWVVTSFSPAEQKRPILCSAEFHVTSLIKPVYFYEAIQKIPRDAVVIEVGPHSILLFVLKSNLSQDQVVLPIQDFKQPDQSVVFMKTVGECHNLGIDSINTLSVLDPINYPLSPKTPNVSHLVAWDHSEEWFVPKPENFSSKREPTLPQNAHFTPAQVSLPASVSCMDFKVNGRSTVPPSHLLLQVWKAAAEAHNKDMAGFPVQFSSVTFHAGAMLCEGRTETSLSLSLLPVSGSFELLENRTLVVTGKVKGLPNKEKVSQLPYMEESIMLTKQDIYKELSLKGYQLSPSLQFLRSANIQVTTCLMDAMDDTCPWLAQLDAPFQMAYMKCNTLSRPDSFLSLSVDPGAELSSDSLCYDVTVDEYKSAGVHLQGLKMVEVERRSQDVQLLLNKYVFEPHSDQVEDGSRSETNLKILIDTVLENTHRRRLMALHIINSSSSLAQDNMASLAHTVCSILQSSCPVRDIHHDILVMGKAENPVSVSLQKHPPSNRGSVFQSDSLASSPLKAAYDLIIAENMGSLLEQCSKSVSYLQDQVTPAGFVLLTETSTNADNGGLNRVHKVLSESNLMKMWSKKCVSSESETVQEFVLYRKHDQVIGESDVAFVRVQENTSAWLPQLQKYLTPTGDSPARKTRVYCVSDYDPSSPSGLIGMANCLKLESYGDRLRCLYLLDTNWADFRRTSSWDQIREQDLFMNIVKRGDHGSFRHIPLEEKHSEETKGLGLPAQPIRFFCQPDKFYILTGGLGGFGLELAEWLAERGAKFLVLTTRSKVRNGYQARKIERLTSQGVQVEISNLDVSTESKAIELIHSTEKTTGKQVGGIFHLANVLSDALFEAQTVQSFDTVLKTKLKGAVNLDKATRALAPESLFVVFSSVVAGFGHHGLANYAFANSAMERLCEKRREENLHGLAIQWGPVGDVGILQESGKVKNVAGCSPKPISSCLQSLDAILTSEHSVISCYSPGELKSELPPVVTDTSHPERPGLKASLCRLLGFKRPEKLRSDATLSQIGVDSLLSFEVQQMLAGDYGLTLAANELMSTTVGQLVEKTSTQSLGGAVMVADTPMGVAGSASGISLTASDTLLTKNTDE